MKIKYVFEIALKNVKENSLRRNIFIFIILLFLLIIIVPFGVYSVFSNAVKSSYEEQYDLKTLQVYSNDEDTINYLKSYDNENLISIDYDFHLLSGYISYDDNTKINIQEYLEGSSPSSINITDGLNDYEFVCPEKMAYGVFDLLAYDELVTTKVGDKYNLTFYTFDRVDDGEYDVSTYTHEFTIKYLYNADYSYTYNTCYVNTNTYEEIKEELGESFNNINLYFKTRDSAIEAQQELKNAGINSYIVSLEIDFMEPLLLLCLVLVLIMSITSLIAVLIYLSNYFKSEYKRIALYKALGFNKKDITKILWVEIELEILISFIISLIISLIAKFVLNWYFASEVSLRAANLEIRLVPLIIYFIFVTICSYLFVNLEAKNIDKLTVRELSTE